MDDVGVPSVFGGIAFDVEDDVGLVFGTRGILERDEKFAGVKVDAELMRTSGAADAEIAEQGFLAGECFFASDLVPLLAFFADGSGDAIPNNAAEAHGRFVIQLGFLGFEIPTEFFCEEFLS